MWMIAQSVALRQIEVNALVSALLNEAAINVIA